MSKTPKTVSILIRSLDRMQRRTWILEAGKRLFQSSSGLSTGCNHGRFQPRRDLLCFNPHPVSRPDATVVALDGADQMVGFNPHPVSRPDATSMSGFAALVAASFNPHPVSRPDATVSGEALKDALNVSILIRSLDRMQRGAHRRAAGRDMVSILIRSLDRMQLKVRLMAHQGLRVSILIRSLDRMQQRTKTVSAS